MIGSLATLLLLSAPPAIPRPFDRPAGAQIQLPRDQLPGTVLKALTALDAKCRRRGGKPGPSPDLLKIADLNDDGYWDYVTDLNYHDCRGAASALRGPAGAKLTIYFGGLSNSATKAYSATVHASRILKTNHRTATLSLTDNADCGKPDAANILDSRWEWCRRLLYWRPAKQSFELTPRPWPGGPAANPFLVGNYAEAARLFTAAVDMGDVKSMWMLAGLYAGGNGVQRDYDKALALWRRAADAGSPEAMFSLANGYQLGLYGLSKNQAEAAHWRAHWAEAVADTRDR